MFSHRIVSTVVLSLGLVPLLADAASAETWVVGEDGNMTIQATIDAALADAGVDDTILVPPGVYDETVVVMYGASSQESLKIRRQGKKGTVTIQGTGGAALRLNGVHDVSVENLTLQSASAADGIPALLVDGSSSDVRIENVLGVAGDDVGATIDGNSTVGVTMTDCDFSGMVFVGFQIEGVGHVLRKCVADACGLNGFLMTDESLLCTLEKCRSDAGGLSGGTFSGVCTVNGSGHRLTKVKVSNGGDDGFLVLGQGHVLEKCEATGSADAGFLVDEAQAMLMNCSATGNAVGFSGGGLGTSLTGGNYDDNTSHGISIVDGGVEIRGVSASGNGGDGALVDAAVFGMKILDSTFKKNDGEGLRVQGQICWVEGNVAKSGNGLVDEGTGNDGRGNKVKGEATNDF